MKKNLQTTGTAFINSILGTKPGSSLIICTNFKILAFTIDHSEPSIFISRDMPSLVND